MQSRTNVNEGKLSLIIVTNQMVPPTIEQICAIGNSTLNIFSSKSLERHIVFSREAKSAQNFFLFILRCAALPFKQFSL